MNLPAAQLKDRIILITGATSGIGKAAAHLITAMGAQVVITGRNKEKLEMTVQELKSQTGNESVIYLVADFCDLDQVREMASNFEARYARLDVLVNNAGAFFNKRRETIYGVEKTFVVNHLAPFLLTNMLMETMQRSEEGRIVNVSSDAHQYGSLDFDDLELKHGYTGMKAYARSKLSNILFTYEAARRLAGSTITVNALHPGHVATNIFRNDFSFIGPALKWVMGLFSLTPEEGADNTVFLATSPEVKGMTGQYFVKREAVRSSPRTYDENLATKLWQISEKLTSLPPTEPVDIQYTTTSESGVKNGSFS